jgi:hypothetical protein
MTDPWRGLIETLLDFERAKRASYQIDGRIIGTGEADFTKGNTLYVLKHQERIFQLMDVPGIEGNETRYTDLVQEAIAKAHLVIYVNGTNKKPESATVEKIRNYLRRGTFVCPIINVRGLADAYEFEEDRTALSAHQNSSEALKQTQSTLSAALGEEILLPGYCVQGLMAFSALAISPYSGASSIHPSREHDLGVHQRKFIKCFETPTAMRDFCKIDEVAGVLQSKLSTFKEDIVESNKTKVRELLRTTIFDLEQMRARNSAFLKEIEVEFENCQRSIDEAMKRFINHVNQNSRGLYDALFNDLKDTADIVVADHIGEDEVMGRKINQIFRDGLKRVEGQERAMLEQALVALHANICQSTERLFENIQRIDFQQRIQFGTLAQTAVYKSLSTGLGWDEAGLFLKNIASYALSFGTYGQWIGAAIGAVIGFLKSILDVFMSRNRRIRSAQKKIREQIEQAQSEIIDDVTKRLQNNLKSIQAEMDNSVQIPLQNLKTNMKKPHSVLEQQIKTMRHTLTTLESMPHGTIRAV